MSLAVAGVPSPLQQAPPAVQLVRALLKLLLLLGGGRGSIAQLHHS